MQRRGMTLWETLIVLTVLVIAAAILWPTDLRSGRHNARRRQCQSNLKQIALAVRQYCADYDGQMPSLDRVAGWRGAIAPYVKKAAIFHCPSVANDAPELSDYWFNAHLSGARLSAVSRPAATLMLGDGYASSDPRVALSQLPSIWRTDENSPAQRHLGGANYAFVDGHVKFYRPAVKPTEPMLPKAVTFALR